MALAEQLYKNSPKTFDLIGRSTNHDENLTVTPPHH